MVALTFKFRTDYGDCQLEKRVDLECVGAALAAIPIHTRNWDHGRGHSYKTLRKKNAI